MNDAIFSPQMIFKIAGKGLALSGILKSGTLKLGMILTVGQKSFPVIGIESFNKKLEEIEPSDQPVAIFLPENAPQDLVNKELIFKYE